jgi:hypothetical protein
VNQVYFRLLWHEIINFEYLDIMGVRLIRKVLPILAIPFLLGVKCNKDDTRPCRYAAYSFSVSGIFSPQRENYNVGDTIYYHCSFPVKLMDRTSNTEIDYSNSVGIGGTFNFAKIDSANRESNYSLQDFFAKSIVGVVIPHKDSTGINYDYQVVVDSFKATIAIRLLSKGVYYFAVNDLSSRGIRGQNCTNAGFSMSIVNSNKNLHLFENGMGRAADALLSRGIFCFRVR